MPTPKQIFDPVHAEALKRRVAALTPAHERRWGTMTAAQAMAHCAVGLEWALGEGHPRRMLIGRLIGGMVLKKVMADDVPMARNTPTARELVIGDPRDLAEEQARVIELIDRFSEGGAVLCTTHPHPFFGPMTPEQWAVLQYKHLDHHLRQFGA